MLRTACGTECVLNKDRALLQSPFPDFFLLLFHALSAQRLMSLYSTAHSRYSLNTGAVGRFVMHCEAGSPSFWVKKPRLPQDRGRLCPSKLVSALLPASSGVEGQRLLGAEGRAVILQSGRQGASGDLGRLWLPGPALTRSERLLNLCTLGTSVP